MGFISNEGLPAAIANGSTWQLAYEDLSNAGIATSPVYISGYHLGVALLSSQQKHLIAVGKSILNGNNISTLMNGNGSQGAEGFIIQNYPIVNNPDRINLGFINNLIFNCATVRTIHVIFRHNTLVSCTNVLLNANSMAERINNTIVNCIVSYTMNTTHAIRNNNTLFVNGTITFIGDPTNLDYHYFLNTSIRFTGGTNTDIASIPRFRTKAQATAAGANPTTESIEGKVEVEWGATVAANCFQNAIVDDYTVVSITDVFMDPANMNFHLKPGCRAINAGSDGKNMGSQPTGGLNFAFPADFHSYTNIDANGNIINPALPAQAISKVKATNTGTPAIVKKVSISGVELHAAGNLIDRTGNLNKATPITAGQLLTVGKKYHCTGETITLTGGRTVLAGANFITAAGETSFTAVGSLAVVYEVVTELDNRNIKTIGIKAHNVYNTEAEFAANVPAFNYEYNADLWCNLDLANNILAGNGDTNYNQAYASNLHRAYIQLIIDYKPDNIPQ